jgi:hypothetical protein
MRASVSLRAANVIVLVLFALAAIEWTAKGLIVSAFLHSPLAHAVPPVVEPPLQRDEGRQTVAYLERELAAARLRLAELGTIYGSRHPTILELRAQIAELEARLAAADEAAGLEDRTPDARAPEGRFWWLGSPWASHPAPPEEQMIHDHDG